MADGKVLFVFDFDNTLVNDNSDTWVGGTLGSEAHEKVKVWMSDWWHQWRDFVNHIMMQLHKEGASRTDILEHMKKLRIYSEALRALSAVQSAHHADAIIISDANSVFIECILEECGVADVFRAVFTNPASFNSEGLMTVTWHHTHSCQLCAATPHMCKGTILKGYLEGSDQKYSRVVYVGDGKNDLCPLLQLGKGDVGVVRKGYGLEKALARGSCDVKPTLHVVDFIHELGDVIESKCL